MQQKIELFIVTGSAAVTGTFAPIGADIVKMEVPLIVMQIFQIVSCSVAIIVGLVTLYKFLKHKK